MPEITEERLNTLQNAHKLMTELAGPKTKSRFEELVKEHHPDVRTTKDELAPVQEQIDEIKKRFDDWDSRIKKEKDDEADAQFFAALKDLKDNHGLTDEGEVKLKQVMKDKIIPDPYVAFNHMRAIEPKPTPPSAFSPTDWGFGRKTDDPDLKRLFEDPDGWAMDEAPRAWNDAANGRG